MGNRWMGKKKVKNKIPLKPEDLDALFSPLGFRGSWSRNQWTMTKHSALVRFSSRNKIPFIFFIQFPCNSAIKEEMKKNQEIIPLILELTEQPLLHYRFVIEKSSKKIPSPLR